MCSSAPWDLPLCPASYFSLQRAKGKGVGNCKGSMLKGVCASTLQPTLGHLDSKPSSKSNMLRGRNSATSADEQPHIGNYRLLKTIGKGNFAKVKLARHILTGKEVSAWVGDVAASPRSDTRPAGSGGTTVTATVLFIRQKQNRQGCQEG